MNARYKARFQQAVARRGMRRMGMRICETSDASSAAAAGAARGGLSRRGGAPEHKLHGQWNESSGKVVLVTRSLYTRRVSGE